MLKEALLGITVAFSSPAEHTCLAKNIYFEARNQSIAGMIAVSHVVLNRVKHERFPDTICEVVKQGPTSWWWKQVHGKEVPVKNRCQFSWYCDGLSDAPKERAAWERAWQVAQDALTLHWLGSDTSDGSMWYHAKNVKPYWRSDFDYVGQIDDHLFYRAKTVK